MGLSHPGSQRQVLPKGISAGLTTPCSHVSRPDPKMLVKGSVTQTEPKGAGETNPVPLTLTMFPLEELLGRILKFVFRTDRSNRPDLRDVHGSSPVVRARLARQLPLPSTDLGGLWIVRVFFRAACHACAKARERAPPCRCWGERQRIARITIPDRARVCRAKMASTERRSGRGPWRGPSLREPFGPPSAFVRRPALLKWLEETAGGEVTSNP